MTPIDMLSRLIDIRIVNPDRFAQRLLCKAHFMLEGTPALLCDVPMFENKYRGADLSLKRPATAYLSTSKQFRDLYPSLRIPDDDGSGSS